MALRHQLEMGFKAADPENTGVITQEELLSLLHKINANLSDAECSTLFPKLGSDGKIKYADLLDKICPPSASGGALKRELSKPMTDNESKAIKEAFDKFDKDSSGYIDLKELRAITAEMGKEISEEEAFAALLQLDKNGDGKVNFDEFSLWWTCTPGLGGYNHIVLGFLKAKLSLTSTVSETFNRVVRKKLDNTDEFSFKANVEVTPVKSGMKVQSSVSASVIKKTHSYEDGTPGIEIKLACKDPTSAVSILASLHGVASLEQSKQEADKIVVWFPLPEEMFDESFAPAIAILEDAAKRIELKLGVGSSLDQILANPNRPLCQFMKGGVLEADCLIGLSALINCLESFADGDVPSQFKAFMLCLGGFMLDCKLTCDDPKILTVFAAFKTWWISGGGYIYDYETLYANLALEGIAFARNFFFTKLIRENVVVVNRARTNYQFAADYDDDTAKEFTSMVACVKELAKGCIGIESVSVVRIPGSTAEIIFTFDNFNPFPMADYFVGDLPGAPYAFGAHINDSRRPLEEDELALLKATFEKIDRDKSGKIDYDEFKAVLAELGATLSEVEMEQGFGALDCDLDSKVSFEEFARWWSFTSTHRAYSSVSALNFLKTKLQVTSMLSRIKSGLSSVSGYVGVTENTDDTVVKFHQEVSPAMVECDHKMNTELKLEKSSLTTTGDKFSPFVTATFSAKSEDLAKEVADKINMLCSLEFVKLNFQEFETPPPKASACGTSVTFIVTVPSMMVKLYYEDLGADELQVIAILVKAVIGSSVACHNAVDFDDILADADTGIYSLLGKFGTKLEGCLRCSAEGKRLALDAFDAVAQADRDRNRRYYHYATQTYYSRRLLIECIRLLQSLDITCLAGYHQKYLEKAMMEPEVEAFAKATTPDMMRERVPGYLPRVQDFGDIPEAIVKEVMKAIEAMKDILSKLDSITSLRIDGLLVPGAEEYMVALTQTFTNYKCFDFVKYMLEPSLNLLLKESKSLMGGGFCSPSELLEFWFGGAWGTDEMKEKQPNAANQMPLWFGWRPKDNRMNTPEEQSALDEACLTRFGGLARACRAGELDEIEDWKTLDGLYAKMILTDQIPRNAFRGTSEAFAYDHIALGCARKIYEHRIYENFEKGHFWFLCTPPCHSEHVGDHRMNVALLNYAEEKFGVDSIAGKESVLSHKAVIDRFGRYPHRNQALGRENTAEEQAWLADVDNLPSWAKRS